MIRLTLTLLTLFSFMLFAPNQGHAQEFSAAQKAELKKMFDEYLAENGQKVLESVNSYQTELQEKDRIEAAARAQKFVENINKQTNLPMVGDKDGDITLVEFFDYNCGYCRKALEEIQVVLKDDKNLKVVFIDMPILGPASFEAAKWSLAAHRQGKYFEYHQALMEHSGQKDEGTLESLAKDAGLNLKKLRKDKDDPEIEIQLNAQVQEAKELGIRGTPGFVLNGELFPGFLPADQIKEIVAHAREVKK